MISITRANGLPPPTQADGNVIMQAALGGRRKNSASQNFLLADLLGVFAIFLHSPNLFP